MRLLPSCKNLTCIFHFCLFCLVSSLVSLLPVAHHFSYLSSPSSQMSYFLVFPSISPDLPSVSICLLPLSLPQEFRQKVMLGTPFVVIWLVGFIADLDIDSWLIKGLMYAGMWIAVQFLSKYVSTQTHAYTHTRTCSLLSWC